MTSAIKSVLNRASGHYQEKCPVLVILIHSMPFRLNIVSLSTSLELALLRTLIIKAGQQEISKKEDCRSIIIVPNMKSNMAVMSQDFCH